MDSSSPEKFTRLSFDDDVTQGPPHGPPHGPPQGPPQNTAMEGSHKEENIEEPHVCHAGVMSVMQASCLSCRPHVCHAGVVSVMYAS
ncbi:hypothetical protein FHG87_017705 [Trinorchestia longiramus]|nr:hypothetical protein FHG87_017705 [Trinorchestia longiramus]